MNAKPRFVLTRAAALALLLPLCGWLAGCEAIFTTSLLSFLQRDPAKLSREQQLEWAEQALASGDAVAMAQAYELVEDDEANELLAARLALELSGVPDVVNEMIRDLETILAYTLQTELEAYFDARAPSVSAAWAAAAGSHFEDVIAADPIQLSGLDMVLGALCLAFDEADPGDFSNPMPRTDAFITSSLAELSPDDPAVEILNTLQWMI
ncbi:MAG: hypothetical protein JW820_07195 [Spirochaetales bacterium]|nr:hypothetical protein [Spirochaetales bacterium]